MTSKRYKKLPDKTEELQSVSFDKLLNNVKSNCTTKFDESIDLNRDGVIDRDEYTRYTQQQATQQAQVSKSEKLCEGV